MNVQVNANYKLTSDERNIIVNRRHMTDPTKAPNWAKREAEGADPTPKETWREVAYYPRIESALNWIVDQQVRDSDADNTAQLLDEITRFQREIKAVLAAEGN